MLKVVIVHQEVAPEAPPDEQDVVVQAAAVATALAAAGHQVVHVTATLELGTLQRKLSLLAPDCIFNLVESLGGVASLLHLAPAVWQAQELPFTGCCAAALLNTTNKLLAKERLTAAGLPTPAWLVKGQPLPLLNNATATTSSYGAAAHTVGACSSVQGTASWIVKSVTEHASSGISDASVWHDLEPSAVMARLSHGTFAERFIAGREFNVTLIGSCESPRVLPPAEIIFRNFPADKPRIVGYAAKWLDSSFEATNTVRCFGAGGADAPLLAKLQHLALRCWHLFGLSGAARVDFRVASDGSPYILEVNANPCLAPDSGFAAAVAEAGLSYQAAVEIILAAAFRQNNGTRDVTLRVAEKPAKQPATVKWRYDVTASDQATIAAIIRETGFFNEQEVAIAMELVTERLAHGAASGYEFILGECDGVVVGCAIFGAVPCTSNSFDLYWLAVHPAWQGRGVGQQLLLQTERSVCALRGSRLYAETSGRPQYAPTRLFYERMGFNLCELLADFYAPGDARATYVKVLSA